MSPICVVPSCRKKNPRHLFPCDSRLRKMWVVAIKRGHQSYGKFYPSKYGRICSGHFSQEDFLPRGQDSQADDISHQRLKKGAVPSRFPPPQEQTEDDGGDEATSRDEETGGDAPKIDWKMKDNKHRMNVKRKKKLEEIASEGIDIIEEKSSEAEDLRMKEGVVDINLESVEGEGSPPSWEDELGRNASRYASPGRGGGGPPSENKNRLLDLSKVAEFVGRLGCPECHVGGLTRLRCETRCPVSSAALWRFQCASCGSSRVLRDSKIVGALASNASPYSRNALLAASTVLSGSHYRALEEVMDKLQVPFGEDEESLLESIHQAPVLDKEDMLSVNISVTRDEEDPGDPLGGGARVAPPISEHIPISVARAIRSDEEARMVQGVFRRLLSEAAGKSSSQLTIKKRRIAAIIDYVSKRFGATITTSMNEVPVQNVNNLAEEELEVRRIIVTSV